MLSRGMTNQEIANESAIAVSAIKARIRQVFIKLGARNRIEAIVFARQPFGMNGPSLPPPGPMPDPLTSTEVRLLELLGRGFTQQEIATGLAMTVGTVKWRMRQIFGKLQVRNRIEALARAREQNWLRDGE
jgi:DNA-binding NarL/FixJ family response regulator